ncbi:hypothetical protein EES39_35055 [Streptomyces sp. ADI92-24]|nr:hypothetical protein EES39_35055 [Streptomyces sp. ADI92-24]
MLARCNGGVGYWNRPNASAIVDPSGEVVGEARWVGGLGPAGDALVVLQLMEDHGHLLAEGALDDAVVVEMASELDACLVEVGLDQCGSRPDGLHPVVGLSGLVVVPKPEFADPLVACRGSLGVAGEVGDDRELVLQPEGVVPAGFCLVGGVRDGVSELSFGVVADGQGGLTRVVGLVVDEEGDDVDVLGLGSRNRCESTLSEMPEVVVERHGRRGPVGRFMSPTRRSTRCGSRAHCRECRHWSGALCRSTGSWDGRGRSRGRFWQR